MNVIPFLVIVRLGRFPQPSLRIPITRRLVTGKFVPQQAHLATCAARPLGDGYLVVAHKEKIAQLPRSEEPNLRTEEATFIYQGAHALQLGGLAHREDGLVRILVIAKPFHDIPVVIAAGVPRPTLSIN